MDIIGYVKNKYKKHGKKAIAIFLVYFVTKWTLTIVFGKEIFTFLKSWLGA